MTKKYRFFKDKIIASVTIELKDDNIFSASGTLHSPTDDCGGQCLDEINTYFSDNPTFQKIYRLWQLYHLNDMHPECEHQHNIGWQDIAKTPVVVREYFRTHETIRICDDIKNKIIDYAKQQKSYIPTDEEVKYLNLEPYPKTYDEELNDPHYKLHKTEIKTRGWLSYSDTPLGLLGKPCPVCNYKYGTSWIKFDIPENDLNEIKELLK
jgi:hypothetical protein